MEQVWQWGIDIIILLQKIRTPFIDNFFICITLLGAPEFYMFFLPGMYWCFNKKFMARIIFLFFLSGWTNSVLKTFLNHPRPFDLNGIVKVNHAGGPGLPSGHAQQSLVLWASLALWLKKRLFLYFSIFIILVVSFSRIYLGVHFPTDVFGGWILGIVIVAVIWPFFDRIEKFLAGLSPGVLVASVVAIPLILSFVLPTRWSVMPAGSLSGFFTGVIFERRYMEFGSVVTIRNGVLRVLPGMFIISFIFFMDKFIGVSKSVPYYLLIVYVKTWIMGIWVSAGAPWMFGKLRI